LFTKEDLLLLKQNYKREGRGRGEETVVKKERMIKKKGVN